MQGTYKEFLRSRYWWAVRKQVRSLFPFCERCGCHNNLQVHHVQYTTLGTEDEYYRHFNLELLCRTCHAEHHGHPAPGRDWSGPEHISTILARLLSPVPRKDAA